LVFSSKKKKTDDNCLLVVGAKSLSTKNCLLMIFGFSSTKAKVPFFWRRKSAHKKFVEDVDKLGSQKIGDFWVPKMNSFLDP